MARPAKAEDGVVSLNVETPEGALGLTDAERALPLGDLITKRMKDALAMAANVKDLNAVLATAVKWEAVQRKLNDGTSDDEPGGSL